MKPVSPLICYYGDDSCGNKQSYGDENVEPDNDVLDMEPSVQLKPRSALKYIV